MMKHLPILIVFTLLVTSCATIVSESEYPVRLKSSPPGATYRVENQHTGELLAMGQTPAVVTLDAGPEFFTRGKYTIYMSMKGFTPQKQPLKARLDGWYLLNILLPGRLIWLFIVDPATGAMWKLPKEVNIQLLPEGVPNF